MTTKIHPSAIVDPGAELDTGVEVDAFSYVGPHVHLHKGVKVGRYVTVEGRTEIGEDTQLFSYARVGIVPQDLKFKNEPARLVIGKRNMIREGASLEIGTEGDAMLTQLGNDSLLMINSHFAHDCIAGDHLVVGMCAGTGGHVRIGEYVRIAPLCVVHQKCRIGDHAFIGLSAIVNRDILPYCMVNERGQLIGVNVRGLRGRGFDNAEIKQMKHVYEVLLNAAEDDTFAARLARLDAEREQFAVSVHKMIDFALETSKQGYLTRTNTGIYADAAEETRA